MRQAHANAYGLTINAECSLPSTATFATINTDLSVQDQHSIISQVSHANLLAKFIWLTTPTSLPNCVFDLRIFSGDCVLPIGLRHSV